LHNSDGTISGAIGLASTASAAAGGCRPLGRVGVLKGGGLWRAPAHHKSIAPHVRVVFSASGFQPASAMPRFTRVISPSNWENKHIILRSEKAAAAKATAAWNGRQPAGISGFIIAGQQKSNARRAGWFACLCAAPQISNTRIRCAAAAGAPAALPRRSYIAWDSRPSAVFAAAAASCASYFSFIRIV